MAGDARPDSSKPLPPGAWAPARKLALRLLYPVERFLHIEAASGIVLLLCAAAALAWANSPWAHSYEALWHTEFGLRLGPYAFQQTLHFWINDGLMTIFFFVVGLEIRREMDHGELADIKRATLPIAAALGGMIAPALLFLLLNRGAPQNHAGWGVPMATDIAFAVGVLALLGKRVPAALRILLLALAIIDDIGAIIVIALFYNQGIALDGFAIAGAGFALVLLFQRFGVRTPFFYIVPGAILWAGMLRSGVHPTLAGVALGLLTPVKPWFGPQGFLERAREAFDYVESHLSETLEDEKNLLGPLDRIAEARKEAVSPVVRLEAKLHPWVAFGIMPLFALANAGVSLKGLSFSAQGIPFLLLGISIGLVVGKPLGIFVASFICVRLRLSALPRAVSWKGIVLVGAVAGIGFTMAIFVASLAFDQASQLAAAKLAVLLGSAISAVIGLIYGRVVFASDDIHQGAASAGEAEKSADI